MDFFELLAQRYSCRKFEDKPVEREKLKKCIEAARLAPSACNLQPWRFVAVDDPQIRDIVAQAVEDKEYNVNTFAAAVPSFILVLQEPQKEMTELQKRMSTREDFKHIDIGIAAEHICLAATAQGLGSVILGWLQEEPLRAALGIPEDVRIPLAIAVGYPVYKAREKNRKPIEEIACFNRYTGDSLI